MSRIHIERPHDLGLAEARRLALRAVDLARERLAAECDYVQGEDGDLVRFRRSGAHGELRVAADRLVLDLKLGLLLSAFRGRIEQEIAANVDRLLAQDDPVAALDEKLDRIEQRGRG